MDRPYTKLPRIEKPNVFIAVPMSKYATLHAETAAFCSCLNNNPNCQWGYVGMHSPELSRNSLIEHHFHNDPNWTHILFVDSDVVPPKGALWKLLCLDADVAVGLYPLLMSEGLYWSASDGKGNWMPMHEDLPKEPFKTTSIGGGCVLARREVLTKIGWPWFKCVFQEIYKNEGRGLETGEDVFFARRVVDEGFTITVDPTIECKHYNGVDLLKLWYDIKRQVETKNSKTEKAK